LRQGGCPLATTLLNGAEGDLQARGLGPGGHPILQQRHDNRGVLRNAEEVSGKLGRRSRATLGAGRQEAQVEPRGVTGSNGRGLQAPRRERPVTRSDDQVEAAGRTSGIRKAALTPHTIQNSGPEDQGQNQVQVAGSCAARPGGRGGSLTGAVTNSAW